MGAKVQDRGCRWTERPLYKAKIRENPASAENEHSLMSSIRLLIVDDSSAMRKMVERALRMADVEISEVFEASNGKEALDLLKDKALDLVLCDINMPEMNGLEFLRQRQVDNQGKNVPVIMITSEGGEAEVAQALSSGAIGYIRKPFTPQQVREQIVPVLGRKP